MVVSWCKDGLTAEGGWYPLELQPKCPSEAGIRLPRVRGVQRDGGVTAGCREVTDTWAMGRGDGELGAGDLCHRGWCLGLQYRV